MSYLRIALLLISCLCLNGTLIAQSAAGTQQPPTNPTATAATIDNNFLQKQFGSTCTLLGTPPILADFDGDGVQDVVIPARCTNPMMDQVENNFVVVDPYDSFFGYGNPKITTQFASEDPERRGFSLLIIHGSGPDAWHAAAPKAKFVIINLPFKEIQVKKLVLKKKQTMGIYVEETGGDKMTSVVFWDGKKYRYEALGSSME